MKRKVIKQGHNTLTITLPSDWVQKFNIKPGDELDLTEYGKDLKISSDVKRQDSKVMTVDISNMIIPMVWRVVSSAYRNGYDELKVTFENNRLNDLYALSVYDNFHVINPAQDKDLTPPEAIQSLVNRFIGYEIVEQKNNYCLIKDVGHPTAKEFENTLRRMFLLVQTISEILITVAQKNNKHDLPGIHIIDTNIDRFSDFCMRVLNIEGYSDFKKTSTMYTFVFVLELLGDEFKRVALHMAKSSKFSDGIISLMVSMDKMLHHFYDNYYNFSKEKAQLMYDMEEDAAKIVARIRKNPQGEEREIAHHYQKIGRFLISLNELRIDMEY